MSGKNSLGLHELVAVAARKLETDGMMPLHCLLDSLLAVAVAVAAESVVVADDHELVAVAARKLETYITVYKVQVNLQHDLKKKLGTNPRNDEEVI